MSETPSVPKAPEEAPNFEEAMARLEQIVRRLESGEAKLDESLALFEEGVGLARVCSARLDEAEGKIKVLIERAGHVVEEPFAGTEAAS